MSVEVTEADERSAYQFINENRLANFMDLRQAFARHRIEAERAALERAAQAVLDHRYDDGVRDICMLRKEHRQDIAAHVRSLMGEGE